MNTSSDASFGFAYVEVLIATALIAVVLPAALSAARSAAANSSLANIFSEQHEARMRRLAQLKITPYADLLRAAELSGSPNAASLYSDSAGTPNRVVVRISVFDADSDPFVVPDNNFDGDGNLYSGYQGLLWLEVATENTPDSLTTLFHPTVDPVRTTNF